MDTRRYLRIVWISALYDLVVTATFATPWTARALLDWMARLHETLGLRGAPPPSFGGLHLFFVSLFGTVVVMWSLLRLLRPRPEHGLVDGLGRAAFSAWQILALASGQSRLIMVFLVPEIAFGIVQLAGYARLARAPARVAT